MALQLGALRDALREAGVSDEKANKAAEELASHQSRSAGISPLTAVTSLIGIVTIGILISQGLLWHELSKVSEHLTAISAQLSHVEQVLEHR